MAGWGDFNLGVETAEHYIGNIAQALSAAITERSNAAGTAVPQIITDCKNGGGIYIENSWFTNFQSTITTLIGVYVNENDSSGNWTGNVRYDGVTSYNTIAPRWTTSTFEAHLGEARLSLPTAPFYYPAAWLNQQIKIINKLKWVKKRTSNSAHWGYWDLQGSGPYRFFNNYAGTFVFDALGGSPAAPNGIDDFLCPYVSLTDIGLTLTYDLYVPLFRLNNIGSNITPFTFSVTGVSGTNVLFDRILNNESLLSTATNTMSTSVKSGMENTDYSGNTLNVTGAFIGFSLFILKYDFDFA